MALSKVAFGQMVMASAHSDSPIDDENLREIAESQDNDPDLLVAGHGEMRKDWQRKKISSSGPMPSIIP